MENPPYPLTLLIKIRIHYKLSNFCLAGTLFSVIIPMFRSLHRPIRRIDYDISSICLRKTHGPHPTRTQSVIILPFPSLPLPIINCDISFVCRTMAHESPSLPSSPPPSHPALQHHPPNYTLQPSCVSNSSFLNISFFLTSLPNTHARTSVLACYSKNSVEGK